MTVALPTGFPAKEQILTDATWLLKISVLF
jgi:hypothetical protein